MYVTVQKKGKALDNSGKMILPCDGLPAMKPAQTHYSPIMDMKTRPPWYPMLLGQLCMMKCVCV